MNQHTTDLERQCLCLRCGNKWVKRSLDRPKQCPQCRQPNWDTMSKWKVKAEAEWSRREQERVFTEQSTNVETQPTAKFTPAPMPLHTTTDNQHRPEFFPGAQPRVIAAPITKKYNNTKLLDSLHSLEYRSTLVKAVQKSIARQILALRAHNGYTQRQLGMLAGSSNVVFTVRAENPERNDKLTIEDLQHIANAFDVNLEIKLVPFSKLVELDTDNPEPILVKSFVEEYTGGIDAVARANKLRNFSLLPEDADSEDNQELEED